MIANLLSPEWAFAKALCDYRAVSAVKTDFDNSPKRQDVPWSRSHIYFANMGGFVVKFDETTAAAPLQHSDSEVPVENDDANDPTGIYYSHLNQRPQSQFELELAPTRSHSPRKDSASHREVQDKLRLSLFPRLSRWIGPICWKEDETNSSSMVQAFLECSHIGDDIYGHYCYSVEQLQADIWVLDAKQLHQAWEYGIIEKLPAVTEDDISDKNKGDFVVKILAVGQIVWFVIQLGDRLYSKLPVSLLEILSFSFAVCTIFTYGLLLDKPKNAESPIVISATRYASPWEITKIAELGPTCIYMTRRSPWIPNHSFHDYDRISTGKIAGSLAGVLFGAIHCVAWNFSFPSEIERILWHISAIVTAIAFPLGVGLILLPLYLEDKFELEHDWPDWVGWADWAFNYLLILVGIVFVISRLFICVEVIRSLAFLPQGAFQATWTQNIPHIG
jgi:hypothetical protein